MRKKKLMAGVIMILAFAGLGLAGCSLPGTAQTSGNPSVTTAPTGSVSTTASTQPAAILELISPADAKAMLDNNPDVLLLDVRTAEEYAAGHIADSQLLPYDQIAARANELPADKTTPIIVYCRSGNRSAVAANTLAELGYTEIYDLGGIQDWPYDIVKSD